MAANSAFRGRIWLNFELIKDFMAVLVTCKNIVDSIKMKAQEGLQHYSSIVQMPKEANSVVSSGV